MKRKGSELIERLTGQEAKAVISRLVADRPELPARVEEAARAVLADLTFEEIADDVEDAMRSLDLDDLNACAGRHRGGYTSPDEAALQLIEEAVEPFLDDMTRRIELGDESGALGVCKGILLGLYRMRDKMRGHDFLQRAEDFPNDHARWVVRLWTGGADPRPGERGRVTSRRVLPREFVERHIPEWIDLAQPDA